MDRDQRKWVSTAVLILSFSAAILALLLISKHQGVVKNCISDLGLWGSIVIILLYAGLAFSPIPADPLTLITGAVFGPIGGTLTAWIGMITATLVEYFIGQRIGEAAEFEENRSQLPWGLGDLPVDSIPFLLAGRMLTGAGSKAVSYLSGIYGIPFWRYLWTSAASTLLGALLFTLIGTGLVNIF